MMKESWWLVVVGWGGLDVGGSEAWRREKLAPTLTKKTGARGASSPLSPLYFQPTITETTV